jgi:hypothetical protein
VERPGLPAGFYPGRLKLLARVTGFVSWGFRLLQLGKESPAFFAGLVEPFSVPEDRSYSPELKS